MHLCVDARLIHASGIGRFLRVILTQLSNHSPIVLSLMGSESDREFLSKISSGRFIPLKSAIYSLHEQLELPLRIPACDLFWSPHFNIPLLPIRAKKRVGTLYDTYHLTFFETLTRSQKLYATVFYKMACRYPEIVTTISDFSKGEILRHNLSEAEKIEMIPLGVDSTISKRNTEVVQRIKGKYSLPERFILTVANLKPHKNFDRTYAASRELLLPLVLVGPKVEKPRVISTGHVGEEELMALYSLAEVFVFPSLYEGFGFPPLEAMACECPVITSNCASLPEACGDAAFYVDPFDVKSIRTGIESVLRDGKIRRELIEKGLQHIRKRKMQDAAQDYVRLFLSLA